MTKNVLLFPALLVSLFLSCVIIPACSKSDKTSYTGSIDGEKPGKIPGMGETPGTLQGTQFKLPAGVSIKGEIRGNDDGRSSKDCVFDGTGYWVNVKMTLQTDSTTTGPVTVEFPPGLVIVSASEGFQHGLLIERILVTVPPVMPGPGSNECQVSLLMYCLNTARKPSDITATYKFGPITNSPLIKDFMSRLAGKKTLYSDYVEGDPEWHTNQENIQEALWGLTDGEGLSDYDLEVISKLPRR